MPVTSEFSRRSVIAALRVINPSPSAVLIALVVFTATVERSTSDICHTGAGRGDGYGAYAVERFVNIWRLLHIT